MSFRVLKDVISFVAPVGILGAIVIALPFVAALVLWAFPRAAVSMFAREDPQKLLEDLLAEEEKEQMRAIHGSRKQTFSHKKAPAPLRVRQPKESVGALASSDTGAASSESVTEPIAVSATCKLAEACGSEHGSASMQPVVSQEGIDAPAVANQSSLAHSDAVSSSVHISILTQPAAVTAAVETDEEKERELAHSSVSKLTDATANEGDGWSRVIPKHEEALIVLRERVQTLKAALEKSEDETSAARAASARDAARAAELDKELRERMRQSRQRILDLEEDISSLRSAKTTLSLRVIELEADTTSASALSIEVQTLKSQLENETEAAKIAQLLTQQLKDEVDSKTSHICSLEATLATLETESSKAAALSSKLKADVQSKVTHISDLEKRLGEAQNTVSIQKNVIDSLKSTISGLESDHDTAKTISLNTEKNLSAATDEITRLSADVAAATMERDGALEKAAALESALSAMRGSQSDSFAAMEKDMSAARERIASLEVDVEQLTSECGELNSAVDKAELMCKEYEERLGEAQGRHQDAEEKCAKQQEELACLNTELEAMRTAMAKVEERITALSAEFEAYCAETAAERERLLHEAGISGDKELAERLACQTAEFQGLIASLQSKVAELTSENAALLQKAAQADDTSAVESMMHEVEESRQLHKAIILQLSAAKEDLQGVVAEKNTIVAELQAAVAKLRADAESETAQLQSDVSAHLGMIETLRADLSNASRRIKIMEATSARRLEMERADTAKLAAERDDLQARLARADTELEALRAEAERVVQLGAEIVQESAAER